MTTRVPLNVRIDQDLVRVLKLFSMTHEEPLYKTVENLLMASLMEGGGPGEYEDLLELAKKVWPKK